ncbi:SRPBCC domain-containing protein [Planctomonas sp. JC2975]|uniref:SRPBCC family protein n=1 Tax=Planctomonas sp. JC2975 TaxID=2729626 RepID=UPI0014750708|nr:SRPBCC domain-containing protein [Planctomonas sp. JC2975]NNC13543.1 SRPBCC domain-containing protein [Planctomonas sp. JC2975]
MPDFHASIDIEAEPDTVFDYLVTADGMTAWMGEFATLEPHRGGRFRVDIAGFPIRGEYLEVDRPNRVVVSWGIAGSEDLPPGASLVSFELTAVSGGTRVDLTHTGLPDARVPGHRAGWAHFLPRLKGAGAGHALGPDDWRPLS